MLPCHPSVAHPAWPSLLGHRQRLGPGAPPHKLHPDPKCQPQVRGPLTANGWGVPVGSSGSWWWMVMALTIWARLHRSWQAGHHPASRKRNERGTSQRKRTQNEGRLPTSCLPKLCCRCRVPCSTSRGMGGCVIRLLKVPRSPLCCCTSCQTGSVSHGSPLPRAHMKGEAVGLPARRAAAPTT